MSISKNILLQAVKTYTSTYPSIRFQPAKDLKPKQIANAVKHICPQVKPSDVVAFWDETLTRNGKKGFLLTEDTLYFSKEFYIDGNKSRHWVTISDFAIPKKMVKYRNCVGIVHENGETDWVYASINQDDLFNFFLSVFRLLSKEKAAETSPAPAKPEPASKPERSGSATLIGLMAQHAQAQVNAQLEGREPPPDLTLDQLSELHKTLNASAPKASAPKAEPPKEARKPYVVNSSEPIGLEAVHLAMQNYVDSLSADQKAPPEQKTVEKAAPKPEPAKAPAPKPAPKPEPVKAAASQKAPEKPVQAVFSPEDAEVGVRCAACRQRVYPIPGYVSVTCQDCRAVLTAERHHAVKGKVCPRCGGSVGLLSKYDLSHECVCVMCDGRYTISELVDARQMTRREIAAESMPKGYEPVRVRSLNEGDIVLFQGKDHIVLSKDSAEKGQDYELFLREFKTGKDIRPDLPANEFIPVKQLDSSPEITVKKWWLMEVDFSKDTVSFAPDILDPSCVYPLDSQQAADLFLMGCEMLECACYFYKGALYWATEWDFQAMEKQMH